MSVISTLFGKRIKNKKIGNQVTLLFLTLAANSAIMIVTLFLWFNGYIYNSEIESLNELNINLEISLNDMMKSNRLIVEETAKAIETLKIENKFIELGESQYLDIFKNVGSELMRNMVYTYTYLLDEQRVIDVFGRRDDIYFDTIKEYKLELGLKEAPFYTSIKKDVYLRHYYQYIYPLKDERKNIIGYYVATFALDDIVNQLKNWTMDQRIMYSIYDKDELIYLSDHDKLPEEIKIKISQAPGKNNYQKGINGHRYYVQSGKFEEMDWTYTLFIPYLPIFTDIFILLAVFLFLTVLLVFCGLNVFRGIKHSISSPIEDIITQLDEIEKRGLNREQHKMKVKGDNEISSIVGHINKMLEKIHQSHHEMVRAQSQLYEMEIMRTEAEISYYQSQINPHFLYNNLEFVRSLGVINGVEEIEKISIALSKIFRYSINGAKRVCVEDEINCIKNYFTIMDLRYPGKYHLRIDVAEVDKKIRMSKMIIQPILENTFKHGFVKERSSGVILLKGERLGAQYRFKIIDTGVGIARDKIEVIKTNMKNKSIGLANIGLNNIHQRLEMEYGEGYGLNIKSRQGHYTCIEILIKNGDDE